MRITEDAQVTSKGRVTIPKRIRDRLGLADGVDLEFMLTDDGELHVRPKQSAMAGLREVKHTLAAHHDDTDLDALRRRSKRAWSSLDEADLATQG